VLRLCVRALIAFQSVLLRVKSLNALHLDPNLMRPALPRLLPLIDLSQLSEEELKQHGTADPPGFKYSKGPRKDILKMKWLKANSAVVTRITGDVFHICGISSIVFTLAAGRKHSPEEILEVISNIIPHNREDTMTRSTTNYTMAALSCSNRRKTQKMRLKKGAMRNLNT
jgi:hypothetical protein